MYRKIDNQKSQTKLPGYKMIELGLTPESWEQETVNNALTRISFPRSCQILSSEIKSFGKYPVIDQGQSFIAGYSDYSEKVISEHLPVIIFGDHTRAIKYVDFPFIIGADGTKVLKPKPDYEAKFFYYALLFTKIPSRGYNRHFSLLKEKVIPKPPLPEQRKIAAILSTVQKAIEIEGKLIEHTKELKKAMMHKLFTEGIGWLSGSETSQKQTEIGPIPKNWEVVRLGEVFSIYAGGDISKINYSPIKTQKFIYPIYSNTLENKGLYGFSDTYKFPENSITVTGRGNLGYAIPRYEKYHAIIRLLVLIPKIKLNIKYVSDFINAKIKIHFDGSSIPQLTRPKISFYLLPLPPLPEQHKIADFLSTIDKKIEHHTTKKQKLEELFRTLLHELMTAKVRVNEVELKEVIK